MRSIRPGSGLALMAAAAAMLTVGAPIERPAGPDYRPPKKSPRQRSPDDMNRKQRREADRSKKQFRIKGLRP